MFKKILARPRWFLVLAAITIILLILTRFNLDNLILRRICFLVVAIYIFAVGYLDKRKFILITCTLLSLGFIALAIIGW